MLSVTESLKVAQAMIPQFPELCVVLGSGWNHVLTQAVPEKTISYQELFGAGSSVPGHDGQLVIATVNGKRVAFMSGRFHTYEGYSAEEVTRPIQLFAQLGLKQIIVTSAVGALNEKFMVGDFVVLNDLITAFCPSPLTGPKFTDMSAVFHEPLRQKALRVAMAQQIPVHEGVYCYVRGPHFETPADKMLYRHLGADVIGMSMVPESIMSRYLGIEVLGLSFVTNLAFVVHNHHDVLHAAEEGSQRMVQLLTQVI